MMDLIPGMAAAAARRVPLTKPPSTAAVARMKRKQAIERERIGANIKKARTEAGLTCAKCKCSAT
jgi:hypothetical protein